MILYFAADLVWASRIKATADALGVACRPARTPEMLDARRADSPVRSLIVDLDAGPAAVDLIRHARSGEGQRLRILAFGPHVAKELFQAARDAGADEVLTRGSFDHSLEDVLLRLAASA